MKEDITYSCGHSGTIEIFGSSADRKRKVAYEETCLCPECVAKARSEKAAAQQAEDAKSGLPSLTGSEKQIMWALTIRANMIEAIRSNIRNINAGWAEIYEHHPEQALSEEVRIQREATNIAEGEAIVAHIVSHWTKSSDWIDHRGDAQNIARFMAAYYRQNRAEIDALVKK